MHFALYVMLCLIWGSTWLVIKVGYGGLGPFNVAALRFLLAGAVLAPLMPLLGARWPSNRTEWALVVWVGLILFAADYGLIYWGEQFLDSGLTSILFALLPLVTIGFAHLYVPGDRITARKLAGTILAFLGIVALFGERVQFDPGRTRTDAGHHRQHGVCRCSRRRHQASRSGAPSGGAQCAGNADWRGGAGAGLTRRRGRTPAPTGRLDVDCDRVPRRRRQCDHVPRLLHSAQDVDRDEPQLHQRVHAGDCAASGIRLPGRTSDVVEWSWSGC